MGTKVADVMTQRPRALDPKTPLNEVAQVMATEDVGAVPLVEGERLVGIVTDRDIVIRAIAKGKDPREMAASEVSSRHPLTVSPTDELSDALEVMAEYQVRRLAVIADDERLVGVGLPGRRRPAREGQGHRARRPGDFATAARPAHTLIDALESL